MQTFSFYIKNPNKFLASVVTNLNFLFADKLYLKIIFRLQMGKRLNLNNPKTFSEKLQWLKLYNRKSEYTTMVDKYAVKEYVANIIGKEYIIPTLGAWDTPNDINWDSLPDKFVLKTNHSGGNTGVIICKNKSTFDKQKAVEKLWKSYNSDIYKTSREWVYKNIAKKIIAEPYIEDSKTQELRDYKFFCFNGNVKYLFVASERQKREEPFFDFFDQDYNTLPIKQGHPNSVNTPEKPVCFEEMKIIASKLSQQLPHVRVDLYEVNGKVYFGELTFFHFAGFVPFEPQEWDDKFGEMIKLPIETEGVIIGKC